MAIIELNQPGLYEVTQLIHEMGRSSTLSFFVIAEDADATTPTFATRTEVKFTVSGVVWFHGRTLPARRSIVKGREVLEYTAADPLEYLGNNPCYADGLGVSEWYNRNAVDVTAFAWPTGKTVQQILTAELASIVGAGLQIGALDFTYAGAAAAVVPSEFQTKGKTWLGLIEALVNESPGLGYWYDPTTLSSGGSPYTRGTLRFYDLSTLALPGTRSQAILARRTPDLSAIGLVTGQGLVETVEIAEDITQSYDRVIVRGWGSMTERYDAASPAWTALSAAAYGNAGPYLRHNDTTGKVEVFQPGPFPVAGGQWVAEDTVSPRPWFPESAAPGYKSVGRRFSVPSPIADLRITRKDATSPAVYQRDPQSMWGFTLQYVWDLGVLQWWEGSQLHVGRLYGDMKVADYSGGTIDDDGEMLPNEQAYGNPVTVTEPRFPLPTPSAYDSTTSAGYFVLKDHLLRRTLYLFSGTTDPDYANLTGQVVFKYWPTYDYVWLKYTGTAVLQSVKSDLALGYGKTLLLYDQRLVKYTDASGAVIKDDTAVLSAAAQAIFDLVKRQRVYGSVLLDVDPATVLTGWSMGKMVRFVNWGADAATYDPPAVIQGIDLSRCRDERRLLVKFDRQVTFRPLEKLIAARDYYEGDSVVGDAGLSGKRGQRDNPQPKPKTKKPNDVGGAPDPTSYNNTTVSSDPPSGTATVRGIITARTAARDTCAIVGYTAQTVDGEYATPANSKPKLRQFSEGTVVFAAEVGSDCLIELVPRTDNSGTYDAQIMSVHERATQWFVKGYITARTAAQSTPPGILYDWESDDGAWSGTGSRPLFCPYNDAVLVDAADVDSSCSILIQESASGSPLSYGYTAVLWECQEKIHFEVCETDSFIYNAGDGILDPDAIVVTPGGEEVVTPDYEVVVSDVEGWTTGVEPRLVVGIDYRIVTDPSYNAVVEAQQTDVAGGYYDDLLVVANSNHIAVSTVGYSTVGAEVVPPTALD